MAQILVPIPEFSGDPDVDDHDAEVHVQDLEDLFYFDHFSDWARQRSVFRLSLKGTARRWMVAAEADGQYGNYQELVAAFLARFQWMESKDKLLDRLHEFKQYPSERVVAFHQRFLEHLLRCKKAKVELSSDVVVRVFVRGLGWKLQKRVHRRKPLTLRGAFECALEAEEELEYKQAARYTKVHAVGKEDTYSTSSLATSDSDMQRLCDSVMELAKAIQLMQDRLKSQPPLCSLCQRWGHDTELCRLHIACTRCRGRGHNNTECKRPPRPVCTHCSHPGHFEGSCWVKYPAQQSSRSKFSNLQASRETLKTRPSNQQGEGLPAQEEKLQDETTQPGKIALYENTTTCSRLSAESEGLKLTEQKETVDLEVKSLVIRQSQLSISVTEGVTSAMKDNSSFWPVHLRQTSGMFHASFKVLPEELERRTLRIAACYVPSGVVQLETLGAGFVATGTSLSQWRSPLLAAGLAAKLPARRLTWTPG